MSKQSISAAAALLGRKGGLVKSERKTAAVRENGKRGGRPRRVCVHCSEPVVMRRGATAHAGHRNAALDQTCGTWGWEWRKRTVD